MKTLSILLLALFAFNFSAFAQNKVHYESKKYDQFAGETESVITVTAGEIFTISAYGTRADGSQLAKGRFYWSIDNLKDTIKDKNMLTTKFSAQGGHYIWLHAKDSLGARFGDTIIRVRVPLEPNWASSNIDRKTPLCKGEQVTLTGMAKESSWMYTPITRITEYPPRYINLTKDRNSPYNVYKSFIRHFAAKPKQLLTADKLDSFSVSINIEHTSMRDFDIRLKCPNGQFVILKNHSVLGANDDILMGKPILRDSTTVGIPSRYTWTIEPTRGKMDSLKSYPIYKNTDFVSPELVGKYYLPNDSSYRPQDPFTKLVGCPIDGDWRLEILDSNISYNGFIFDWELKMAKSYFEPLWKYTNTYTSDVSSWSGSAISATSIAAGVATATAIPNTYGPHSYVYKVKDNWLLPHSTGFSVEVEKPSFTTDWSGALADDTVKVKFTNKTSWSKSYSWTFDNGLTSTITDPITEYIWEKIYTVKLIVKTADAKCEDFVTMPLDIKVPEPTVNDINCFSPNGDGTNDVFLVKNHALKAISMVIYSRWGRLMCELNGPQELEKGWDGTIGNNGGAEASPGTYYYIIKYEPKKPNFPIQPYKGSLYLVR